MKTITIRLQHDLWVALRRLQEEDKINSIQDACITGLKRIINENTKK